MNSTPTYGSETPESPVSAVGDLLRMRDLGELLTADITEVLGLLRISDSTKLTHMDRQSIATAMGLAEQLTIELVLLRGSVLRLSMS